MIDDIRLYIAMAAGLTDHILTYQEYIHLPIFDDGGLKACIDDKLKDMESEALVKAIKRTKRPKAEEEILWQEPPEKKVEVA